MAEAKQNPKTTPAAPPQLAAIPPGIKPGSIAPAQPFHPMAFPQTQPTMMTCPPPLYNNMNPMMMHHHQFAPPGVFPLTRAAAMFAAMNFNVAQTVSVPNRNVTAMTNITQIMSMHKLLLELVSKRIKQKRIHQQCGKTKAKSIRRECSEATLSREWS
jgi:hypothetical protein